jgi:hypothetical protein
VLDHVIAVNAAGLHRVLTAYVTYEMQSRTHLALEKDAPISRPVMSSSVGRIVVTPHVGGLHHRYDRAVRLERFTRRDSAPVKGVSDIRLESVSRCAAGFRYSSDPNSF